MPGSGSPHRVAELFGESTDARTDAAGWSQTVAAQNCPFTSRRCFKVRKSDPGTAIGTCVVRAGASYKPLIICPNRLLAEGQVFADALSLIPDHEPGNEYHLVPEVAVPGGTVDYFVVSVKDGAPVDFVGVEFQALDTTGTVWPRRQEFLAGVGSIEAAAVPALKPFGINWKMTAKTILVQLHHKTKTFEAVGRKLVLVLQQELMDYMTREFSFGHLAAGSAADSLHFHPYRLEQGEEGLELSLGSRKSTDTAGIEQALSLGDKDELDADQLLDRLGGKIGDDTRWQPSAHAAPPPVADLSDD